MTLKSDAKFEEKLIFCFKNEKTLVRFDLSTRNPQNDHFSPKHSKLRLWWDAFIQNRKCKSLKFKKKKKKMTNKNNAKFEEELTCCFKIDILQSVSLTLQRFNTASFWLCLLSMVSYPNFFSLQLDRMTHTSQKEFETINWWPIKERYNQCVNSIAFKYFDNHIPIIWMKLLWKHQHLVHH